MKKNGKLQRIFLCKVESDSVTSVGIPCLRYTATAEKPTLYKPEDKNPNDQTEQIQCAWPTDAEFPDVVVGQIPLLFGEGSRRLVERQNVPARVVDITVLEHEE